MPHFLERFVLPVLAAFLVGGIVLNPMKFDIRQQASLALAVIFFAYFVGHTLYRRSTAVATTPPTAIAPLTNPPTSEPNIHVESHGSNSPNIVGNSAPVTINTTGKDKKH